MTGQWVRVTGGYQRCVFCGTFRRATPKAPMWKHYVGVTATACACPACAGEED